MACPFWTHCEGKESAMRVLLAAALTATVASATIYLLTCANNPTPAEPPSNPACPPATVLDSTQANAVKMLAEGRQTFRFETFGDEAFWGDTLKLHQSIKGNQLGGVGPGLSPKTAFAIGLKVDMDALPPDLAEQ